MKFIIYAYKEDLPETKVYKSFLDWQFCTYEIRIDLPFVLNKTYGKPSVLVYDNLDNFISKDFFEFIDYYNKMGFILI